MERKRIRKGERGVKRIFGRRVVEGRREKERRKMPGEQKEGRVRVVKKSCFGGEVVEGKREKKRRKAKGLGIVKGLVF